MRKSQTDTSLSRRGFGGLVLGGGAALTLPFVSAGTASAMLFPHHGFDDGLQRANPHDVGVDAAAVLGFLEAAAARDIEFHGFMVMRHGKVAAEGWWSPYGAARPHMTHSLTKSTMACGVGLALAEGHFKLDDKVVSFFPENLPAVVDDNMAAMTVEDLLTMRTGHAGLVSGSQWRGIRTSWVTEFFKIPVVHKPGTFFAYTSAASYMLSAIVTKTTGQTLRDYMEPRFFKPLGIVDPQWDLSPGDINPGGNGLTWKLSDALKMGALHLNGGQWNGQQVLPAEWVRTATRDHVPDQYGYQWWINPELGAYSANGMFGQYVYVFPEHDAVVAFNSALVRGESGFRDTFAEYFPAAFRSGDPAASAPLKRFTEALVIMPTPAAGSSQRAIGISGRTYQCQPNEDGIESLSFTFQGDECIFTMKDARGVHVVDVGLGRWIEGETTITGNSLHHEYQPDSLRVVAGAGWRDADTLEMTWQFAETTFRDTARFRFTDTGVAFDRSVNVNSAATTRPTVIGVLT